MNHLSSFSNILGGFMPKLFHIFTVCILSTLTIYSTTSDLIEQEGHYTYIPQTLPNKTQHCAYLPYGIIVRCSEIKKTVVVNVTQGTLQPLPIYNTTNVESSCSQRDFYFANPYQIHLHAKSVWSESTKRPIFAACVVRINSHDQTGPLTRTCNLLVKYPEGSAAKVEKYTAQELRRLPKQHQNIFQELLFKRNNQGH